MIIECPRCDTRFRVDASQIPAGGRALRCGRCHHVFRVEGPASEPAERATLGTIGCLRPEELRALRAAKQAADPVPAVPPEAHASSTVAVPAAAVAAAMFAAGGAARRGATRQAAGDPRAPANTPSASVPTSPPRSGEGTEAAPLSPGPRATATAGDGGLLGPAPGAGREEPGLELDLDLDLDADPDRDLDPGLDLDLDLGDPEQTAPAAAATAPDRSPAGSATATAPPETAALPPPTSATSPAPVPSPAATAPLPALALSGSEAEPQWYVTEPSGEQVCVGRIELRDRIRHGVVDEDTLLRPLAGGDAVPAGQIGELERYFRLKRGAAPAASGPARAPETCAVHPGNRADHMCTVCHTLYCGLCIDRRQFGSATVPWCRKCDDRCVPFEGIRHVVPFWRQIPRLLKYPLEGWGLFMMLCCAVLSLVGSFLPGPGKALYFLVLAYQLHILKESSEGKTKLPDWPELSDIWEITARGLKAVLVTLIAWSPVLVFNLVFFAHTFQSMVGQMGSMLSAEAATGAQAPGAEFEDGEIRMEDYIDENGQFDFERFREDQIASGAWDEETGEAFSEENLESMARAGIVFAAVNLLLIPLVLLYYPMCLMIAAIFNTVLPALNPMLIGRCISRIKADYAMALLFCGILAVGGAFVQILFALIPLAGGVLNALIGSYIVFLQMHILGWTAHQGWDRLNWDVQI